MHYNRLLFFLSNLILVTAGTAAAQPVSATIDATRTGSPITRLIFGGFMEPATTGVWAEMLTDPEIPQRDHIESACRADRMPPSSAISSGSRMVRERNMTVFLQEIFMVPFPLMSYTHRNLLPANIWKLRV